MLRRSVAAVFSLLVLAAGAVALPGRAPAEAGGHHRVSDVAMAALAGDFLALRTLGTAQNVSDDPTRTIFEFDLYSMATGEKIGTAIDDVFCSTTTPPPCQVFDAVTTFRLPHGEITNHAQVSITPDPQHPGHFLVTAQPTGNTIEAATGAYAGRTGRVSLIGFNDGSRYPGELTLDDRWIIELDPR